MLSFKHQNVMSLIGLCLDGDVPLIIMPFMSDGSVLDYVRKNRQHLYLTEESSQEKVIICTQACFVHISSCSIVSIGFSLCMVYLDYRSQKEVSGYVPSDC